jgi:hypothetical protein
MMSNESELQSSVDFVGQSDVVCTPEGVLNVEKYCCLGNF